VPAEKDRFAGHRSPLSNEQGYTAASGRDRLPVADVQTPAQAKSNRPVAAGEWMEKGVAIPKRPAG
jgi:hypothetical protein